MVIISLKVDQSLLDRIDATAREDGENRSESIRRYLGAMINWRRDRAIWGAAQERATAEGVTPHAALFRLIAVALTTVKPPRQPATLDPFRAILAPRPNAPTPSASTPQDR